ncbi:unnamed protein product [Agarophyton chilense]|eukprot:gb/GEZJ01001096.1/.p1 GENE.gb/GEZJ01001096.1/~~gb/GEZJ01001096.1/.p1  ORF type:complete len:587 (+),score=71.71 gb/GEZJ01001096.1/:265-1761(+)
MSNANKHQSELDCRPTYLPPLSPSAESHPHHATGVPALVSYPVKLSADIVEALLSGEDASIVFDDDEQGKIFMPNRPDVTFTTRSITDHDADTARSVLYSRRGNDMRLVGPIYHEMEIDRFPNKRSHPTKKRPVQSRNISTSKRAPKEPDVASDTSKAPRARKTTEKRPRAAPRRPTPNLPPPPPQPQKQNGNNAGIRIRSVPALRSAPASPTENGRQAPPKRSAPQSRSAIGALGPRPPNAPLSKPARQQTPSKARLSPRSNSRVPSPNVHSPSSPRVGTRRKMDDPEDVRRHVVHSLALGDMTMTAIRRRHEARNMEGVVLGEALGEVAERSGSTYRLKKRSWREVYDDYNDYNDMEKKRMKQNRVEVSGLVEGKLRVDVINDDLLQEELSSAAKLMARPVQEVKDDAEEERLRKNYEHVHRLYSEVIDRMGDVNAKFRRLGDKLKISNESERAHVSAAIQSANKSHAERFKRFQRVLPKMHGFLKHVRQTLERYD